jgi:signal recognition particle subunit SEC65
MALGYNAHVDASNKVVIGNSSVTSIGGYSGWTNFSDGRYKKNVNENVPGLDFIRLLRPVTYTLDITAINNDQLGPVVTGTDGSIIKREAGPEELEAVNTKEKIIYTGFIAQEVESAARQLGYDFSGVDAPANQNDHYGLRYAEFVVPMVKAMQEQQVMIEETKKANNTLQKQNEELNKRLDEVLNRISALEGKSKN